MTPKDLPDAVIERRCGEPRALCAEWLGGAAPNSLLLVEFTFESDWSEPVLREPLTAIYCWADGRLTAGVTGQALAPAEGTAAQCFDQYAREAGFAVLEAGAELPLATRAIPKPWGQEIWYTGVEQRGVCAVSRGGGETPLPWVQAVLPQEGLPPPGVPLVLLKILDPAPRPVTGDLYFELHEEKQEVYVVTHVDERCWPGAVGSIRLGFDQAVRRLYASDTEFREAYLASVVAYEACRRSIDALGPQAQIPGALEGREQALREEMERFSQLQPLRVGDVVKVPLLMPHSLQHGVRTVEFQTPVYERKILSFAQKVLTQDHWDTAEAVAQMVLEAPPEAEFEQLEEGAGLQVERIVDFDDFEVQRVSLRSPAVLEWACAKSYSLAMVVEGVLAINGREYSAETALVLPQGWHGALALAAGSDTLVLLLALPRSGG